MERTLCIIKPDGLENGHVGEIITRIEQEQFHILGMKKVRLNIGVAKHFYAVHKDRPFFDELVEYMCSGPVVLIALERQDAVKHWRDVIGDTDPANAKDGTIRKLFGVDKGKNTVHGSDSAENGSKEIAVFFSEKELIDQE